MIEFSIHVMEASHVTLKHLDTAIHSTTVRVEATHNLYVSNVHFRNASLEITDPTGDYMIRQSILTSTVVTANLTACSHTNAVNCSFVLHIKECTIQGKGGVIFTIGKETDLKVGREINYHSIRLSIANSTISTDRLKQGLKILISDYPIQCWNVEVSNVTFGKTGVKISMPLNFTTENATYSTSAKRSMGARVLIDGCKFLGTEGGITITLNNFRKGVAPFELTGKNHPDIVIANTKFEDCTLASSDPAYILGVWVTGNMQTVHSSVSNNGKLLTIQNCTFKKARIPGLLRHYNRNHYIYAAAAITLTQLQGYRVVMAGGNCIELNEGYGIMLYNSQVEFHGYNEISKNSYLDGHAYEMKIGGGGIYMSSVSQLLLAPGTVLNVTANNGYPYGGGIYISPYCSSIAVTGVSSTTIFVDCYVEKHNSPRWCFFQFINSDGQSVNASELAEHNATVLLSNNTASHGGNNVFNGHFQNCSLQTADVNGTLPASRQLILDVFHQYPPMDEEPIPSYPYVICLCIDDELNCIRKHTLVVHIYPVQTFPISVQVLGDWQQVLPIKIRVSSIATLHTDQDSILTERDCAEVYRLGHPKPGSSHLLGLKTELVTDAFLRIPRYNAILVKRLKVKVFNSCSPGLVYKEHECTCNTFLKHHMFTCTVRTTTTTYRADQPHYWIRKKGNTVFLSANCPNNYCNSAVLQSGLTLNKNTQNQQCSNDHRGLLCSECPTDYSSVFGSYKCKECSSVWLLQLPLHALGGVIIVAGLFLLNLTLLQGTIMGVVLYTNIMGLMGDSLQEHAWGPLFFLLSVLNLQSGSEVCFYDGMDEFWKALLQFAFPFYLFTLLILIIIVNHRCGYRMFRKARFIARRAVPVLATIMVLTYTSLVNAVIAPLRYTTLYNVDTAQGETVWLYQPSLPFFGGQHLVIGILSIAVTVLYLIPFTFTMLFGDLMSRYFHKLWFSHFMDSLHGGFRWPLGFWIGLRLLVRVILVVTHIFTNADIVAYYTLVTIETLLVVQLLVKPFRDPDQFRNTIDLRGALSLRSKCKRQVKIFLNSYHTPLFDSLYLLKIVVVMATAILGSIPRTNHELQQHFSTAGINILIILALALFAVILVYHAYNFFPVPEKARSCAQSCWSTMCAIPSMLKDTQCCRRRPKEEEEPRRSPIPILILRPPEIDESYESESDSSSYTEQPPPDQVEVKESSLQEPLLTHGSS